MTTTQAVLTAEDLWKLPDDGNRHELVRGELHMMAPAGFEHGNVGSELLTRLRQHVKAKSLGVVVGADTGFIIRRGPDTVRSPDVAFVSQAQIERHGIPSKFFPAAPDLAVEVLSPTDTVDEIEDKVGDFLDAGTRLVWVVNPRRRTVTIHRPGPLVHILRANEQLSGDEVVSDFACQVADLFS